MNESPILAQNVSRNFGSQKIVRDLSFSVKPGSIYGFLGRNGAGKTTTLRMLAGLIKPDAGDVRILGSDPFTMGADMRQWFGYLPEKPIIGMMSARSLMMLGARLYPTWDPAFAGALMAKYGVPAGRSLMKLSQGNQRLATFIATIASRPKVLLLDEPAANLDVVARRDLLDDILELQRDGECTVLFSTHILSDVERIADEIGILAHGKLQMSEPLDALKDSVRQVRFFEFRNGMPDGDIPECLRAVRGRDELVLTLRTSSLTTPETLAQRWSCRQETRALSLEDIFVELSRNQGN